MERRPFMTIADLLAEAERDGIAISRSTLYREHARKRIAFVKIGSLTFVRRAEWERYLRASEKGKAA